VILRWALRELLKSRRDLAGVFFILIVGFLGPLLSSSLETSVDAYLQLRSKHLLSADLAVGQAREFKPEEVTDIQEATGAFKKAQSTEFVTMAKGRDVSTLIEVQAVDENFPIYGIFKFKDGSEVRGTQELSQNDVAWVFPEVLAQLGLRVGDELAIGQLKVKIVRVLKDAPGISRGGVFAPRLFIGHNRLEKTRLTEFGSQAQYRVYLQLPAFETPEGAGVRVKEVLDSTDVTIRTPTDATVGFERFFQFFNLYLVSVSMIVFTLSWVSSFYILQIYLQERLKNSAVLLTFGSTKSKALAVSALQIFAVILFSLLTASIIVSAVVKIGQRELTELLPPGFELVFTWGDFTKLLFISMASAVAFLVPSAMKMNVSPLGDLLNESTTGLTHKRTLAAYAPLALVFIGLAITLVNSVENALILTAALTVTIAVSYALARILFKFIYALTLNRPGLMRLVATQLARSRFGTNLCFITILIGTLVLNAVPHLMKSAVDEIQPLQGKEVPALFLFNIAESAKTDLEAFASQQKFELRYLAPIVQARITKVNDRAPENEMFQKYPVRLTYRGSLIKNEKLLKGTMPSQPVEADQRVAVSIEDGFADRTGLKLGDTLTFDVQGVPVDARITSLRQVKWTDFNPNFFMVLQPGAIDEAPKSYLASVYLEGGQDKASVQYELVKRFPDLSVLDIGRTIEKVVEIVQSVIGPVKLAARMAVLMSFLILMGVISHNLSLRRRELDIQKLLGADLALIRRLIVSEYLLLALGAAILGSAFAIAITALVTSQIFQIGLRIDVAALLVSVAGTLLLTSGLTYLVATRVLRQGSAATKL